MSAFYSMTARMNEFHWMVDEFFEVSKRGSTISTEIRAGTASFLTLSYLLLVNPQVMGKAGLKNEDVVTATCLSCAIPTIIVGLFGNLPFVMAPGLGLSAFFTYGLVIRPAGATGMSWQQGLSCVFAAGVIMLVLSGSFMVQRTMRFVPDHIKLATIIGIGLLLATIGFESAGIINHGEIADLFAVSSWSMWVSIAALLIMGVMNFYQVPGSIVIGVVGAALALWGGKNSWPSKYVELPQLADTWLKLSFDYTSMDPSTAIPAIATFLLVALFDCSGCLIGLSMKAGLITNINQPIPRGTWALLAASLGTMLAALTGCSPIIIAVECTAGIIEGGKTGITALTAAAFFLLSLFFAPLFGAIPIEASAPVLVLIGSMMMREVSQIQWEKGQVAIPSFLTLALMPLSHSISNGIWFGMGSAAFIGLFTNKTIRRCLGSNDVSLEEHHEEEEEGMLPGFISHPDRDGSMRSSMDFDHSGREASARYSDDTAFITNRR